MANLPGNELGQPRLELPGVPQTYATPASWFWLVALVIAVLIRLWVAAPARGLTFDLHPGCGEWCEAGFWTTATPQEVAAKLAEPPRRLDYRRHVLRLAVRAGLPLPHHAEGHNRADPNVVDAEVGSSGGVTPFEMASQPDVRERLGPALFRMMEDTSKALAR